MQFNVGDEVELLNDPTRVGVVRSLATVHADVLYYRVFWGSPHGTTTVAEDDLAPHAELSTPSDAFIQGRFGTYGDFQRLMTLQRLIRDEPLRNNVYAFNASRTRFYPYQFKPLLKFLDSAKHRILICDEVGLGKTIEAGLILLELRARQTMRLVLVVCPSNLRDKWRQELRQRFGEDFRVLDAQGMITFLDDYDENQDRITLNGIVSLETLRGERVRNRFAESNAMFDLVIVDEAHHLRNFGTSQREVMQSIAEGAQAMVMLTATPIHLGQENLYSLLNLLDDDDFRDIEDAAHRFRDNEPIVMAQACIDRQPPEFEKAANFLELAAQSSWVTRQPLLRAVRAEIEAIRNATALGARDAADVSRETILSLRRDLAELNLLGHILTRTRKKDVHDRVAVRRAKSLQVTFTPKEQEFYDTVTALVRRENEKRPDNAILSQWRLNMPQRRMASSLQGMVEFYGSENGASPDEVEDEESLADLPETGRSVMELSERELRAQLNRIVATWPQSGFDAKYDVLLKAISDVEQSDRARKVLIFATFKHTVRYLERRLKADGISVIRVSGDTPIAERPALIARFRDDPDVRVMLSTRVGSEGLDFQFCSTLVNYDLPWNPMEVEQRIGRLDRIGQAAESIVIINLWTQGTIEERILRRLYDRLGIFERSIGDMEAILGDMASELHSQMLRASTLSEAEAELAVERAARAIENRRKEVENLERSAAQFVGVDSFFEEEVTAIQQRRRYVTGQQLYRFLGDFLVREVPKTRLQYDFKKQSGRLFPDEGLRTFLRDRGRIGECLSIAGAVGSSLEVTLDSQFAFNNPKVEFLSVVHPLIVSIAEHYTAEPPPAAAQHVLLRTKLLEPGIYFFFVHKLRVKGARTYSSLEAVFLNDDLQAACDADVAEELMGAMVESGETAEDRLYFEDPLIAQKAVECGVREFLDRAELRRVAEQASNEAFLDQRIVSIRSYYRKNIKKKQELLARAVAAERKESYLRMTRGQVAKLEGELHIREKELDQLRTVTQEHDELAAGILQVVAG